MACPLPLVAGSDIPQMHAWKPAAQAASNGEVDMTNALQERDEELKATAALLLKVPGGPELLEWVNGVPNFGDAEVVSLPCRPKSALHSHGSLSKEGDRYVQPGRLDRRGDPRVQPSECSRRPEIADGQRTTNRGVGRWRRLHTGRGGD